MSSTLARPTKINAFVAQKVVAFHFNERVGSSTLPECTKENMEKDQIYTIVLPKDPTEGIEYQRLNETFSNASVSSKQFVFLDCKEVDSFYSQFQALIALYGRRLLEMGKELILVNITKRCYHQIEVSGLNKIIKAFPQETEAIVVLKKNEIKKNAAYDFSIIVNEPKEGEQVIELKGTSVDVSCRDKLREAFEKVKLTEIKKLKLELKQLEFIDSFSIGVIAMERSKASKSGCELKIANVNELIKDMLELTNIGDTIENLGL